MVSGIWMRRGQAPHLTHPPPPLPPFALSWWGARLCGRVVGPLWRWWCESVCAHFKHVGRAKPSLVAPTVVRKVLTWCLPSLICGPCTGFTVPRVQNKHVSSTHPETKRNLHHVSEYPLGLLIHSHCALFTASHSLHLPDNVLQHKYQDRECFYVI